jgi:hypothetical protein
MIGNIDNVPEFKLEIGHGVVTWEIVERTPANCRRGRGEILSKSPGDTCK